MKESLRAKNKLEMEPNIPKASGNAWLEKTVDSQSCTAIIGSVDKHANRGCNIIIPHGMGSLEYRSQTTHIPTIVMTTVHNCKVKIHANFARYTEPFGTGIARSCFQAFVSCSVLAIMLARSVMPNKKRTTKTCT